MKRAWFSGRVFVVALLLFPRWFRDQYGDHMKRDFVEHSRVIGSRSGWAARVAFQFRSVGDVPGQALRVRRAGPGPTTGAVGPVGDLSIKPLLTERRGMGRGWEMGTWLKDLKIAARTLSRRPGFSLGVALTLGLGIGATTTVYSVVDGVVFRPLPYDDPSRLVAVGALVPGAEWGMDHVI